MTTNSDPWATSGSVLSLARPPTPLSDVLDSGLLRAETGGIDLLGVVFDADSTGWVTDVAAHADRIDDFTVVTGENDISPVLSALPGTLRDRIESVHAEGPTSLGELGIHVSEVLGESGDVRNSRLVFVDGFERALTETSLQTTFRFLHILAESTAYTDAVLHVSLDPTACDQRAVETVSELFDSVVE